MAPLEPPARPRPLFWRVFAANAVLLVLAAGLLVVTPATVSDPVAPEEVAIILGGVLAMVALNLVLVRRTLAPLERLAEAMRTADPLDSGARIAIPTRDREVADVTRVFNDMLERLAAERRESTQRTLAAQERERLRIARELHDEIGQALTAILLLLRRAARETADAERAEQLADAQAAARAAIDDVKRIVRRLRPPALDELGLVPALADLAERFGSEAGVHVERELEPRLPELGDEAELAVYRVAQESLTNVARHARASRVRLRLARSDGHVVLAVDDDGTGINGAGPGHGVRGMRERAMLVGGRFDLGPSELGGACVRLELPANPPGEVR